jgi:choline dehydrogenase
MAHFDYVIVGGGAAGCVLANRLTEDPQVKVAILEYGTAGNHKKFFVKLPAGMIIFMMPNLAFLGGQKMMYMFESEPQAKMGGRTVVLPRGKALGGSSMVNGMIYIRGQHQDYDDWEALGNKGWGFDSLLPYFKKSENFELAGNPGHTRNFNLGGRPIAGQIDMGYHGVGGPLNVAPPRSPNRIYSIFLEAAHQAGFKLNADFNGADQEGVGYHWLTQRGGERWAVESAFANEAKKRPNLEVITEAKVLQILVEGRRAVGVEYEQAGEKKTIRTSGEVLLSCGSFASPQVLMLSGIGDPAELKRHGIPVKLALPGVGKNYQDHIDTWTKQWNKSKLTYGLSWSSLHTNAAHVVKWFAARRGMFTTNTGESGGYIKSSPDLDRPDLQLFFTSTITSAQSAASFVGHGWATHACLLRPKSSGYVGLRSGDPHEQPLLQPNFFADEDDLERLVRGLRILRNIVDQPAMDDHRGEEIEPGRALQTDDELRDYVRTHSQTMYHPTSTCKMGHDPMAVVSPDTLKVHGMENLRIIDASIMPTIVSGNTLAPTVCVAERGADIIKRDNNMRGAVV